MEYCSPHPVMHKHMKSLHETGWLAEWKLAYYADGVSYDAHTNREDYIYINIYISIYIFVHTYTIYIHIQMFIYMETHTGDN